MDSRSLSPAMLVAALSLGVPAPGHTDDWRAQAYRVDGGSVMVVGKGLGHVDYAAAKSAAREAALAELVFQTGVALSMSKTAILSETSAALLVHRDRNLAAEGATDLGVTLVDEAHETTDTQPARHNVWVRLRVSREALEKAKRDRRERLEAPRRALAMARGACNDAVMHGTTAALLRACADAVRLERETGVAGQEAEAALIAALAGLTLRYDKGELVAREGSRAPGALSLAAVDAGGATLFELHTNDAGRLSSPPRAPFTQPSAEAVIRWSDLRDDDALAGRLRATAAAKRIAAPRATTGAKVAVVVRERVYEVAAEKSLVAERLGEHLSASGYRLVAAEAPRNSADEIDLDPATLRSAFVGRADVVVAVWVDISRGEPAEGFQVARIAGGAKAITVVSGEVTAAYALREDKGLALSADRAARAALDKASAALTANFVLPSMAGGQ